ncbi:MAG: hypothetical protein JWO62_3118 [Acidimicrobiaceae bacterium]|nr:hypothetical protein [Acidimicrobiaceae bacterium]
MSRPIRLVQAGNSKTTCIYAALGSAVKEAESATGNTYQCVETFSTTNATWADWTRPWLVDPQYGYVGWLAAEPTRRTVILTENLVPDPIAATANWRARGAAGAYDKYARQLSENLIRAGFGYSVIRLGPEMNGPWENDWIGTTPVQRRQWARYFARIVRTMRGVPGAHFLFDWNVNAGYENLPLTGYYPGNAYVDIVGVDAYDEAPIPLPPVSSPTRWTVLVTEPLGLTQIYKFARQHRKPLSIPEWATLDTHGDDSRYVDAMGRFVLSHDVAYQCWYDVGDNHIFQLNALQAPNSLAAYIALFGPHSRIATYQRTF